LEKKDWGEIGNNFSSCGKKGESGRESPSCVYDISMNHGIDENKNTHDKEMRHYKHVNRMIWLPFWYRQTRWEHKKDTWTIVGIVVRKKSLESVSLLVVSRFGSVLDFVGML